MTNKSTTRITIVGLNYAPEISGIAVYTTGLAEGLADQGANVRVVTAYPHYPAWEVPREYEGNRLREMIGGVRIERIRPYMPKTLSGLKRLFMELRFGLSAALTAWDNPAVIVLVSPALFATLITIARAKVTRGRPAVVVWVQDLYGLGVSETGALGQRGARIMSRIESAVLNSADEVVVIHERFKNYVTRELGVSVGKVSVVRNWTHLSGSAVNATTYRDHFEWSADEIIVLHAGNMGAKQALENVVEAARLADATGARVHFVLMGDGSKRAELEELGRGIKQLTFINPVDEKHFRGALAAADILLVNEKPGVTEMAVPSKLTSYFAAGRPVLAATDMGSITADEVELAKAGARVDAGNPAKLLDGALALGKDRARSDAFGRNARKFQEDVLSSGAALGHYAEIINRLALQRGR
jgi:colanic acid biosynthesis glycosyl transferase WcaI